jgi:uncharacterized protein YndB with AHSA1/START domain
MSEPYPEPSSGPGFEYVTYIRATPDQVWAALTEPQQIFLYWGIRLRSEWTAGATMSWEVEGVVIDDPGQVVITADAPTLLEYTWHTVTREFVEAVGGTEDEFAAMAAEDRSRISFRIDPVDGATRLTLRHTGFAPGSMMLAGVNEGWPTIVSSLKSLLETGEPLELG